MTTTATAPGTPPGTPPAGSAAGLLEVSEIGPGITQLRICDPDRENRLSHELVERLIDELTAQAANPDLRVLVVAGTPQVWCAGGTLRMLQEMATGEYDELRLFTLCERLLDIPVPVIGALAGHAVGGGLGLALCCDILVGAENRRYGVNSASMGFAPTMGLTTLLPAAVGHHFAAEMIFTAKYYRGRELAGRGLFNAVEPDDLVEDKALELAERIAEKPRHVLDLLKDTLALPKRVALQEAAGREPLINRVCFTAPDIAETLEATYLA